MRLTPEECEAIAQAARQTLPTASTVSLFGSRTDDNARGGDIDLLVEGRLPMTASEWVARRQAFTVHLYRQMGERRIDVLLANPQGGAVSPLIASARRHALELVRT